MKLPTINFSKKIGHGDTVKHKKKSGVIMDTMQDTILVRYFDGTQKWVNISAVEVIEHSNDRD